MHCIRSAFLKKQKDMKRVKRKTFDALSVPLICAAYLCLRFLVFPALFQNAPDSAQAYAATGAVYGALVLLLPGGAYFARARLFAEKADEREEKVLLVGTKSFTGARIAGAFVPGTRTRLDDDDAFAIPFQGAGCRLRRAVAGRYRCRIGPSTVLKVVESGNSV